MLNKLFSYFYNIFFHSSHSFAPKLTSSRRLCKKFERLGARLIARFRPNRGLSRGISAPIRQRIISIGGPAALTGLYGIHTTSAPTPARIQMPLRSISRHQRRSTCGESACGRRIHGLPTVLRPPRTAQSRHIRGVALALLA
jgi:hypothetical protein